MYKYICFLLLIIPFVSFGQNRDRSNWIDFGSSHPSKWLQIAPGMLGPNALMVPRMDYALIGNESKIEAGAHYHQMPGDTAINSFLRFFWNIAPGRAVVEFSAIPSETYHLTNAIRDQRQIYYDDNGWNTEAGDISISTYVQLMKNKKYLPDLSLSYTIKTTTGDDNNGRYTDAEMNNFYLAIGKSFLFEKGILDEVRVAAMYGFYVWQTNKVEIAQDEGPVFQFGLHLRKDWFNLFTEFGGYTGYDAYEFMDKYNGTNLIEGHNDPIIFRTRFEKTGKHFDFTAEYQHGFRDYDYETFRLGVVYHFEALEWYK